MISVPSLPVLLLLAALPCAVLPCAPLARPALAQDEGGRLVALPSGASRLAFPPGTAELPAGAGPELAALARRLEAAPGGRVTVEAQAAGPANDVSAARRLSLARARAVREGLIAAGLPETRIDLRALGRTEEALDAADILPPGVPHRANR